MQKDWGGPILPPVHRVNLFHYYTYTVIHSPNILPSSQGSSAYTHAETNNDDFGNFPLLIRLRLLSDGGVLFGNDQMPQVAINKLN
jgi:hypothetical protein